MNFEELKLAPAIVKAVLEQGYETPTAIQAQAIPLDGLTLSFSAGVDTLAVAAAVQAAVVSLVNNLNPGEPLAVAAITAAAKNVDGIVNVAVVPEDEMVATLVEWAEFIAAAPRTAAAT